MWFIRPKMLFSYIFFVYISVYLVNIYGYPSPHTSHTPKGSNDFYKDFNTITNNTKIDLNSKNILQICLVCCGLIALLWQSPLLLCIHVRFVCFYLNLHTKNNFKSPKFISIFLPVFFLRVPSCTVK